MFCQKKRNGTIKDNTTKGRYMQFRNLAVLAVVHSLLPFLISNMVRLFARFHWHGLPGYICKVEQV